MYIFKNLKDLFYSKVSKKNFPELIWVGSGQFINLLFGFGLIKIISKMGTEVFGEFALILTLAAFIGMTLYGPITQGFIRFYYHYRKENSLHFFIRLIFKILTYSCGIILLLSLLFSLVMHWYLGSEIFVYILFGIFIISLKLDEFFNSYLNIIRERKRNTLLQSAEKLLIVASLLLLLFSDHMTLVKSLIIYSIIIIIFIIIKYYYLKDYHKNEFKTHGDFSYLEKRKMLSTISLYIYPFLIWGLSGWLQLNSEKWIIAKYLSTSDVGIYSVMMSLINALIISPYTAISEFVSPIIFQKFSDLQDKSAMREGIRIIFSVMFFVFIVIILVAILTYYSGKNLIIIISGEHFTEYYQFLPLLALGVGLFYLGQIFSFIGMGLNNPQKYLSPKITVGILSVIFNIFFINIWGIGGVVFSVLLIGTIYFAYISIINFNILKKIKIFQAT